MNETQVPSAKWWRRPLTWIVVGGVVAIGIVAGVLVASAASSPGTSPTPTPAASSGSPSPSATPSESASESPSATPSAEPVPEPEAGTPPSADERQHFLEVMQTGNTQPFMQDFADEVYLIIYATECCGALGSYDAISNLPIRPELTATWNFTLDEATLAGFRAGTYAEYFPVEALVGLSSDGDLVSFVPGENGKIVKIFVSATTDF